MIRSAGTQGNETQKLRWTSVSSWHLFLVSLSTHVSPRFIRPIVLAPLQRLPISLKQILHSIDEAGVVAEDIFANAQDWHSSVRDAKICQNGSRKNERLLADRERGRCRIEVVASFLCVWCELYVAGQTTTYNSASVGPTIVPGDNSRRRRHVLVLARECGMRYGLRHDDLNNASLLLLPRDAVRSIYFGCVVLISDSRPKPRNCTLDGP